MSELESEIEEEIKKTLSERIDDINWVAYSALFLFSVVPIWYASYRSLFSKKTEQMSGKDIAIYPFLLSGALYGLYLVFKYFNEDYVNLLIMFYFSIVGVFSIKLFLTPFFRKVLPKIGKEWKLDFTKWNHLFAKITLGYHEKVDEWVEEFDYIDILGLICGIAVAVSYLTTRNWEYNWIISNLFGFSFAVTFIEFGDLSSVKNGFYLLGGLFFYDIYWVYFTDVMITVAKKFEGPIKMVWPKKERFAMIGLGDIVIPGIFIAMMYRFDKVIEKKKKRKSTSSYFKISYIFYIIGWIMAIGGVLVFDYGQPALLYLVPALLGSVSVLALIKGDFYDLLSYESEDIKKKKKKKK